MADIAITFAGKNWKETTYEWRGERVTTGHFAEALVRFFAPTKVTIFSTEDKGVRKTAEKTLEQLKTLQPSTIKVISSGSSEKELWQIFDEICGAIPAGSSIIFDVTHSFRYIPMLSFLATNFLKLTKNITIERIVYGNYEARSTDDAGTEVSPVLDLTAFSDLNDWISDTNIFIQSGNATPIAKRVKSINKTIKGLGLREEALKIQRFTRALNELSASLYFLKHSEIKHLVEELNINLKDAQEEIKEYCPPLYQLLGTISNTYEKLVPDNYDKNEISALALNLNLIRYMIDKKLYFPVPLLAREWFITYVFARYGSSNMDFSEGNHRENIAAHIGSANRILRGETGVNTDRLEQSLLTTLVSNEKELLKDFDRISQERNKLAHTSYSHADQTKPETIVKLCQSIPDILQKHFDKLIQVQESK